MSRFRVMPAHYRQQLTIQDELNIRRATQGSGATDERTYHRNAADNRTLRGIPAIGPGVTGAIPGTRPEHALR